MLRPGGGGVDQVVVSAEGEAGHFVEQLLLAGVDDAGAALQPDGAVLHRHGEDRDAGPFGPVLIAADDAGAETRVPHEHVLDPFKGRVRLEEDRIRLPEAVERIEDLQQLVRGHSLGVRHQHADLRADFAEDDQPRRIGVGLRAHGRVDAEDHRVVLFAREFFIPKVDPFRPEHDLVLGERHESVAPSERRFADLFATLGQCHGGPLLRPDRFQIRADGLAKMGVGAAALQVRIQIVRVPGCGEPPEATARFEEVHQVVVEQIARLIPRDFAEQTLHIDDVVADQQVGPRAGRPAAEAERRDARADGFGGPRDREGFRGPRRRGAEVREDGADAGVAGDGVAQVAAALFGDHRRRADNFHPQAGVRPEFPHDATAHLHALAVIAGEFDEGFGVGRQKGLEFDVDAGLFQPPTFGIAEGELEEVTRR